MENKIKLFIIIKIFDLQKITNYLLDNLQKEQISVELIFTE